MLYELIGIVRPGNVAEVKEIVLAAGNLILQNQGVVRGVSNWGVFALPRTLSKHQLQHKRGHYFAMRFDSSSAVQDAVKQVLAKDPRMIRYASTKLGDGKLGTLSRFGRNGGQGPEGW
ncbi:30S ribosomal protein S6 [Xylariales sp. PMI_506]|nr:30S ribosomal protein S6 [Xylariales sp. PMI_506]